MNYHQSLASFVIAFIRTYQDSLTQCAGLFLRSQTPFLSLNLICVCVCVLASCLTMSSGELEKPAHHAALF